MKGSLEAQEVKFLKTQTKCYIATFWALGCLQYVCCVRGGVGFHLSKGSGRRMGGCQRRWQRMPPSRNFEVQVPMFFLQTFTSHTSLIWLLAQWWEAVRFCAVRPSTQEVRGKKGGRPSKTMRPKVQVRHQTAYPDDTLAG